MALTEADAERLALKAFGWFAADPERLGRFLAESGAALEDVPAMARDPGFPGFVLDALLGDERLARAFAAEEGLAPEVLMRARFRLSGANET